MGNALVVVEPRGPRLPRRPACEGHGHDGRAGRWSSSKRCSVPRTGRRRLAANSSPDWPAGRRGALSAWWPTTTSARLHPRPRAGGSLTPALRRRPADRALPGGRDPRRLRTLCTYLGVSSGLGPDAVDAGSWAPPRSRTGGLPVGPAARQGGDPAAAAPPRRRPAGGAHALRPVLRRAPPRRVPGPGGADVGRHCSQRDGDLSLFGERVRRRGSPGCATSGRIAALTRRRRAR